jgi:propionyl-CoA carboxylase alpha chain
VASRSIRSGDIRLTGHAIECRLYAEDADAGFLPATGRLHLLRLPHGEGIRVDNGVLEGQDVSSAFDPMLAKIAADGADRAQAIARLREAMRDTVALGTVTNAAYLERVLAHPQFASGDTHTGFLAEHAQALRAAPPDSEQLAVLLGAAALTHRQFDARFTAPEPLGAMGEWRN